MGFSVGEEPYQRIRDQAAELVHATRRSPAPLSRFEWAYQRNPDGPAVIWTIRKEVTGELAGFTVALPRRFAVDGAIRQGWHGCDFTIHPKFRTLGLALKLRRAASAGVDAGRVDFFYHHPSTAMAVVSAKTGMSRVSRMVRVAKVLRTGPALARSRRLRWLFPAAGLADAVLRIGSLERWRRPTCSLRMVEEIRFDDRFDRLFEEAASIRRILAVRDARYLNWRYGENPLFRSHAILAEEGRRLLGYAVFSGVDGVAKLEDLLAVPNEAIVRDLVSEMIRHCRRSGMNSISARVLEGGILAPVMREFGFVPRVQTSDLYAYAAGNSPWREAVIQQASWFMTSADED